MSAIIVVDAFWGDSGKGKVAAFLAQKHQAAYSVRAGIGTNAGHSILFADGSEIRTRQLPCGFLHPDTQLRIGSGVAVDDPELFFAELDQLESAELWAARADSRRGQPRHPPVASPERRLSRLHFRQLYHRRLCR